MFHEKMRRKGVNLHLLPKLSSEFNTKIYYTYYGKQYYLLVFIQKSVGDSINSALLELVDMLDEYCFSYTPKSNGNITIRSLNPPKASWNIGEFIRELTNQELI